jgi:hypothetical protein
MSNAILRHELKAKVLKMLFVFQTLVSFCFLLNGRMLGQAFYSESVSNGHVTPNPDNLLDCLAFVRHDSVKRYLKLDDEQSKWVEDLLRDTGGDPGSYSVSFSSETEIAKLDRNQVLATARNVVAARESIALAMIDPVQRDKLRFVTLFVEVKRWGIRESLLKGFVGEELGLSEGQYQLIADKLDLLEKERQSEMRSIGKKIESDIVSEITAEQQELWKKSVGNDFQFLETEQEKRMHRAFAAMGRKPVIPNPDALRECVILLQRQDVAQELMHSDEQSSSFKKASRSMTDPAWVSSMLNDKQLVRVKQLAFRYEAFRIGIHKSMSDGYLGKTLGISKSQADAILKLMPEHQRLVIAAEHESIKKCLLGLSERLDKHQKSTLAQIIQVNCEGVE